MNVKAESIKYRLRAEAGTSLANIAKSLGVTRGHVSMTLYGNRSSRVEKAIADALGESVETVFPDRYPVSA